MIDKWKKLAVGMLRAKEIQPDFIMFQDADDLISRQLVAYAHANRLSNGWVIRRGYQWMLGSAWITLDNNFHCGTDSILNTRLITYPNDLHPDSVAECVMLKFGHTTIEPEMARRGTPLRALPFRGAIYTYQNGENWTSYDTSCRRYGVKWLLRKLRSERPMRRSTREEFSITRV